MNLTQLKFEFTECFAIIQDAEVGTVVVPVSQAIIGRIIDIMNQLNNAIQHNQVEEAEQEEIRLMLEFFGPHVDEWIAPGQVEEELTQVALRAIHLVNERTSNLNTPSHTVAETTSI